MINALKGRVSARLLGTSSHHRVNQASLMIAATVSVCLAVLCSVFAFVQWRVSEQIVRLQREQSFEISQRVAAAADMATHQANTHRGTLNCLLSRDIRELDEADTLRKQHLEGYSSLVARFGSDGDLENFTRQYQDESQKIVDLFRAGRKDEAIDLRLSVLRPVFIRWQEAHNAFTKALAEEEVQKQKVFGQNIASMKRLLFTLLFIPIFLIFASIAAITATLSFEKLKGRKSDIWTR